MPFAIPEETISILTSNTSLTKTLVDRDQKSIVQDND